MDNHMTSDEFRRRAHQVVDWMADYIDGVESLPVLSRSRPGEIRAALPADPPTDGEPFDALLGDFQRLILPGITHWQHPSFFAYFPANHSPPSILAEMLTSALAVNGMNWATSPAATELETHVLEWLRGMAGIPSGWAGVIQDTASCASLCALLCAREAATGGEINETGLAGRERDFRSDDGMPVELQGANRANAALVAYVSDQAHSSIEKGAKIAGFGRSNVRVIETDENYAMDVGSLERAIERDRGAGRRPAFVCATVGTTSSTAVDPLRRIGEVAARHGLWLHVDAALAGSAAILPEFRWLYDGLELGHSLCFNPHKWLLTNFDCCCMYVRDAEQLQRTFSITPEYLRTAADSAVINYRDWGIPLGRRFRALKLWFVIRSYGVRGLQAHLRNHIALAQRFADWVRSDPAFEILAPHPLNTVCFRYIGGDRSAAGRSHEKLNLLNQTLLDGVNATGRAYLTHTKLRGRLTLRMSIGQSRTQERHVRATWELIRATADGL